MHYVEAYIGSYMSCHLKYTFKQQVLKNYIKH